MDTALYIDLKKSALRLREVNRLVIKSTIEGSGKELYKLLDEFRSIKKSLKIALIDTSISKIDNKEAQQIINQIVGEHVFEADKIIANIEGLTGKKYNVNELNPDETDQLEADFFYSWFSGYEYINNLYEIGAMILGVSVPKILVDFVSEARSCFAFQQYNALYSLCRTIIEVAVRDICKRKMLIKEDEGNTVAFKQYHRDNISQLINKISRAELRRTIKDLYYNKTSFLIHGHKTTKRTEAKELFRETIRAVQKLYSQNGY